MFALLCASAKKGRTLLFYPERIHNTVTRTRSVAMGHMLEIVRRLSLHAAIVYNTGAVSTIETNPTERNELFTVASGGR
jgi:hypothetical protein